jgi:hypothetical protein
MGVRSVRELSSRCTRAKPARAVHSTIAIWGHRTRPRSAHRRLVPVQRTLTSSGLAAWYVSGAPGVAAAAAPAGVASSSCTGVTYQCRRQCQPQGPMTCAFTHIMAHGQGDKCIQQAVARVPPRDGPCWPRRRGRPAHLCADTVPASDTITRPHNDSTTHRCVHMRPSAVHARSPARGWHTPPSPSAVAASSFLHQRTGTHSV